MNKNNIRIAPVYIIKYTKEKNSTPILNKKKNKNTNNNTKHKSAVIALLGKIINMDNNKIATSNL